MSFIRTILCALHWHEWREEEKPYVDMEFCKVVWICNRCKHCRKWSDPSMNRKRGFPISHYENTTIND